MKKISSIFSSTYFLIPQWPEHFISYSEGLFYDYSDYHTTACDQQTSTTASSDQVVF